jgi:colanic acid biosynthesis protein WcaH
MSQFIPEPLYRQMLEHLPIACVDVAIVAQGSILLLKRTTPPAENQWWLPGGRVHKGETLQAAAVRKTQQEVGIDCQISGIIYTGETIFEAGSNGFPLHTINICFLAHPLDSEICPQLDQHHQTYQWVKSIPDLVHPYITACLLAAGLRV